MFKSIPKTVWTLGLISLFTDMASEMLYPVLPLFMQQVGMSILGIGVLEGFAQLLAGYAKGYFGRLSDVRRSRVPFIRLGYSLSAVAKPLMGFLSFPWGIFVLRSLDRLGKGIRTAARDALLSLAAPEGSKVRIFGFHRSMDTIGASVGPLLALIFLVVRPGDFRNLFFLALVPGVIAIGLTWRLRRVGSPATGARHWPGIHSFLIYLRGAPGSYLRLIGGLLFFGLINSSDFFLLLKIQDLGISEKGVIGIYIFYNLIYALLAFPAGILADRWRFKWILVMGFFAFGLVYLGLGFALDLWIIALLFFLYGAYAAMTEGIAKAWISNLIVPEEMATAVGAYEALLSICTFLASVLAGWVWYRFGSQFLFAGVGLASAILLIYFLTVQIPERTGTKNNY